MRFALFLASMAAAAPAAAQTVCPPNDVFVAGGSLSAGPQPARVLPADTNADGNTDLVVVNGGTGSFTVGVLLGVGDGTFGPLVSPVAAPFGSADNIAVGDLNADGRDDVAVVASISGSGNIRVFFSNPDGSLQAPLALTATTPRSIALADWNGDGITDILTASFFPSTGLGVLLSNADGTFQPQASNPVGTGLGSIVPADFNNDGRLDIATANGVELFVYVTRPDGSFGLPATSPADTAAGSTLRAADLNRDGSLDLVAFREGRIAVFLATGVATFGPQQFPLVGANTVVDFDIADLDGDTLLDFAVVREGDLLQFYKGNGDGTFQAPVDDAISGLPADIAVAGFDGSGALSVAVAGSAGLTLYGSACSFAPTLANQPVSVQVNAGSATALAADVALGTPPLIFQWRRDGVPVSDGPDISGAQTSRLSLGRVSPADIGVYDLLVTNGFGHVASQPAVLSVVPAPPDCPGDFNRDGIGDTLDILDFLVDAEACP